MFVQLRCFLTSRPADIKSEPVELFEKAAAAVDFASGSVVALVVWQMAVIVSFAVAL